MVYKGRRERQVAAAGIYLYQGGVYRGATQ
jgi:hypothetical protein